MLKTLLAILFGFITLYVLELLKKNKEKDEERLNEALEANKIKLIKNR